MMVKVKIAIEVIDKRKVILPMFMRVLVHQ